MSRPAAAFIVALAICLTASRAMGEMATVRFGTARRSDPTGQPRAPAAKPPTGYVVRAAAPPAIDGVLDEQAWRAAPELPLATTIGGDRAASQQTLVRLMHDDAALYIALRCAEPRMDRLTAATRGHDVDVWTDDSVEIFLGFGGTYWHFGIAAGGGTYDAHVKDRAWNSGMKAATARHGDRWTAELAIPLKSMAGADKPPPKWIGNFFRNRLVTGSTEEFAWSPTFSGDSHVPERFGTLIFGEPPATAPAAADLGRRDADRVRFTPVEGGVGVLVFDLSSLPAGARVYRADLVPGRTAPITGADAEAMIDIEIYPVAPDWRPPAAPTGPALRLRPPWFDSLDAADHVRRSAGGPCALFVKACPRFDPAGTWLDVAFEAPPPATRPAQPSALRVLHRAGQTFITWKEPADIAGRDELSWSELRAIIARHEAARHVRYIVYRHDRPITRDTIHEATPLAAVAPLSAWNINGRNIERPIDHVIATREVFICGQWNPFGSAGTEGDFGRDCPIDRLVIEDGAAPLARDAGLHVHTVDAPRRAFYAVVACADGVQNTGDFSPANASVQPVEETPASPRPVLQGTLPRMPFFNYADRRLHYVQWVAPPLTNRPSEYFNWSVAVPEDLDAARGTDGVPAELNLHRDGNSYWRTHYRLERNSIVLCPHDFPVKTWWYGHHESLGTLRSFRAGCIQPYTERRLLAFLEWAATVWPIDRNRVIVTGCRGGASGTGALRLGLRHPQVFSLVVSGHGLPSCAELASSADRRDAAGALSLQSIFGRAEWAMPADTGRNVWHELDMTRLISSLPVEAELPLVTITSSNQPLLRQFHKVFLESGRPVIAEFSWGGTRYVPVSASETFPNVVSLDIRRNMSVLAFDSAEARKSVESGGMGEFNRDIVWSDIVDEPGRYEATISVRKPAPYTVTVRRTQRFEISPARRYRWAVRELSPPPPAAGRSSGSRPPAAATEGPATVRARSVLSMADVPLGGTTRLVITTEK